MRAIPWSRVLAGLTATSILFLPLPSAADASAGFGHGGLTVSSGRLFDDAASLYGALRGVEAPLDLDLTELQLGVDAVNREWANLTAAHRAAVRFATDAKLSIGDYHVVEQEEPLMIAGDAVATRVLWIDGQQRRIELRAGDAPDVDALEEEMDSFGRRAAESLAVLLNELEAAGGEQQ